MSGPLHRRLLALEAERLRLHGPDPSGPQVIRIVAFGETVPRACLIVANRHGDSGHVGRREGETEAAFLARVEAERLRLHGTRCQ